jgi:Flp pilus assembly protein TadB
MLVAEDAGLRSGLMWPGLAGYFFFAFLTAAFGFAAAFVAVAGFFAFFFATIGIAVTPSLHRKTHPASSVHQHIAEFAGAAQHFVNRTLMHERHAATKH